MRLYRFSDLVGNNVSVSLLKRALASNTLKNFLIFSGVMGTGKSTSAEIVGLALTCEEPVQGEPCLNCSNCKSNVKALQTSGVSTNLVKKNIAKLKNKEDMNELINDVFVLQGSIGNNVYIIEEAHELSQYNQTTLLEELDRLSDNTYVMLTTTRPFKLLPELRSRAISYPFNRLNPKEAKVLFEKTVTRLGIHKVGTKAQNMILKYAKGVPRDIVKLIEFVRDSRPSEEELRVFLGNISNETFIDLFSSCLKGSMRDVAISCENLLVENSLDTIYYQIKEFMANVIFFLETKQSEEFSKEEKQAIQEVFDSSNMYRIATMVEKLDGNYTEADFRLFVIKISQLNKGGVSTILTDNAKRASEQKVQAQQVYREERILRDADAEGKVKPITMDSFNKFNPDS